MGILSRIFGTQPSSEKTQDEEHAVIVYFEYGLPDLSELRALESKLESEIERLGLGEYDGDEIAIDLSDGMFFMYGPNADDLFNGIKPILQKTAFTRNAKVKLRYGPPEDGVKEIYVQVHS